MSIDRFICETITDADYPDIKEIDDDGFVTIYVTPQQQAKRRIVEICENCGFAISASKEAE